MKTSMLRIRVRTFKRSGSGSGIYDIKSTKYKLLQICLLKKLLLEIKFSIPTFLTIMFRAIISAVLEISFS